MSASVPESIGKYRIIRELAKGGWGTVYIALHPSLGKEVVIKKLSLRTSGKSIRERFKREAQILIDISNTYIVRVFDYFTEGKSDYIVEEYVEGMPLDKLLEKQKFLPPQIALLILWEACYGLKAAHSKGIIHRDIKPANILISTKAEIKLADFGIATTDKEDDTSEITGDEKVASSSNKTGITKAGSTLGTPAYMSPEQLLDSSSVDKRTDIYSMGVMLYEMLTGTRPFSGDLSENTRLKIQKGKYIPIRRLNPSVPSGMVHLVKKMMHHKVNKRYSDVDKLLDIIKRYMKPYEYKDILEEIAHAVATDDYYEFKISPPRKGKLFRFLSWLSVILIFSLAGTIAWVCGLFHYTVLSRWYTPVSINLVVPSVEKGSFEPSGKVFFYKSNIASDPKASKEKVVSSSLRINRKDDKNSYITLGTRDTFLRRGEYRIKIIEGSYVWYQNIVVADKPVLVDLDFLLTASPALKFYARAVDSFTGEDLTLRTNFFIETEDNLIPLDRVKPDELKTRTQYTVHVLCSGYKEEQYAIYLDWYQSEVFISCALKKEDVK